MKAERIETYTNHLNRRYIFICEMTWGCVPIITEKFNGIAWAMQSELYQRTEIQLDEGKFDDILENERHKDRIKLKR